MMRIMVPLIVIFASLTGCGGSTDAETSSGRSVAGQSAVGAPAAVGPVDATVMGISKVSETRVSRTVFDYAYRVKLQNGPQDLTQVLVTLTAVGAGSTIIKGTVGVGELPPNASVEPTEVVVIRHDRAVPFDTSALRWTVTGLATIPPPPPSAGVLLTGDPAANAADAVVDFAAERTAFAKEYVTDAATGIKYQRTQLAVALNASATIGTVNAALQATGARIVFMQQGSTAITLQVPDPGSLSELTAVGNALKATGAFDSARPVFPLRPARLPSNLTPADAQAPCGAAYHHAAARLPAAWNAVPPGLASGTVGVIIADFFAADASTNGACGLGIKPASHGWHVEGILAGDYGGAATPYGKVTGSLPVPLSVRRINLSSIPSPYANEYEFIAGELRIEFGNAPSKRYVLNLSLWFDDPAARVNIDGSGEYWVRLVRGAGRPLTSGYEKQVIQVSAAGNDGSARAANTSPFNRAVTGPLVTSSLLQNGIIVENRVVLPGTATSAPKPGCRSGSSSTGGTLAAIGTDVYSAISSTDVGYMSGTSMAAPQVAGVAAMMLAIAPRRSVRDVIDALVSNADPQCGDAPMMDAYASVLALDETAGLDSKDPALVPARLAILHPSGPDLFSVADFKTFVDAIFSPNTEPNYTNFDLNGDGITGDASGAEFNLDMNTDPGSPLRSVFSAPPRAADLSGAPPKKASGAPVDERAATDFEILCYYATSKLFSGTAAEVATVLRDKSVALGRGANPLSCAKFADAVLRVNTVNAGWTGLPATIEISGLAQTTIPLFQIFGDPGNTCGSGERGGPIFSASVDTTAQFFSATILTGLPQNLGGAGINRRPCSSFVARKTYPPFVQEQVWINATGRGQTFGGSNLDWEIQIRYTNGDPRAQGAGAKCQVGVVPNSGNFAPGFDSVCTHELGVTTSTIVQ